MIDERQMEERHYSVYVHISPSGKYYVGMTGNKPEVRWGGGSGYCGQRYFYNAIKKYGWENFEHEVVASHLLKEEAENFEKLLIQELRQNEAEFGYNITSGGESGYSVPGEKNPMYGKHHTEEARKKIAEAGLDRPAWNKGKHHSEETKEKMKQVWHQVEHPNAKCRKVKCVETGEVFESAAEATRYYNLSRGAVAYAAKNGGKTRNGLHWEYLTEGTPFKKKIRCVDTGEIFSSMAEAARKYGGHPNNIGAALQKGYSKSIGHYWEFVEEE